MSGAVTDSVRAGRLDALATAWTVLARLLLAPPGEESLANVRDAAMLAEWPLHDEDSDTGVTLLAQSASRGEDVELVRSDFRRLFVGPESLQAPPWESVHRSPDRLLFEEQTFQVREWYARHGLVAPRLNREPDDHIGLELDFLATLLLRAMEALDDGRDDDALALLADHDSFLATHVLPWAPELMGQIRRGAQTSFYRGVGALGAGALRVARDSLT